MLLSVLVNACCLADSRALALVTSNCKYLQTQAPAIVSSFQLLHDSHDDLLCNACRHALVPCARVCIISDALHV
ncbi:hypothetical protein JKP88DRAFT_234734 [Tribonema minus]|uniref:Secreted protein n=1 Tax=Tribonema minus TaxID=303371 RepID=A0A835Z7X3_9STRA|nr:hypothetical protein JKP88DRAFT_234734 [Tribonema minus]